MREEIRVRWKYLCLGLGFGYPLCCVIRFMCDPLGTPSACVRGFRFKDRSDPDALGYVPCGIFHKPHQTAEEVCGEVYDEYYP